MTNHDNEQIRTVVREQYGKVARGEVSGCSVGCGPNADASLALGYSAEDLESAGDGANLGLGCGNPHAIAALREGQRVLDLGSGGGFDCFLASKRVGATGKVFGVDMTADMVSRARQNAQKLGASNVEFRLGEIEHLPIADASIDVILSNCVINLSPDKVAVFREAFRVLAPGGRLAISDVVATAELPAALESDLSALTGCVSGAAQVTALEGWLTEAGFESVRITLNPNSKGIVCGWMPGTGLENFIASASIEATKPGGKSCCAPSCCGEQSAA